MRWTKWDERANIAERLEKYGHINNYKAFYRDNLRYNIWLEDGLIYVQRTIKNASEICLSWDSFLYTWFEGFE